MEKQNKSTKRSNSSSEAFATTNKTIGLNSSLLWNLPTMSTPTLPPTSPHSKSGTVSNHNSFLTPYKETIEHGTNFARPPPEIVNQEDQHYEVKNVVDSKPSRNRKGILYLIKWKGYPLSKNSWEPTSGMRHVQKAVQHFHCTYPYKPRPNNHSTVAGATVLKEG